MFPPRSHEDTLDARLPTSPSGAGTPQSGGGSPFTPDSLLGVGEGEHRVVRDAIRSRLFPALASSNAEVPLARIGRFVVRRRLGEGGMGVVFAAHDEELDRAVAIKLLRGRHRGDERSHTRMLREAQALARLSHPNVVQIFDVGVWRGDVYLAMEFVRGETLRRWLRSPRAWTRVLDVLIQAGRGLQAAHDVQLVHRDFKPDNVMVGEDGRVRVLDFGLVRATNRRDDSLFETDEGEARHGPFDEGLTRTGSLLGTPHYMAPERLGPETDAASDDPRCDQFSFCATAYEALFGQRPFAGNTLIELIETVGAGNVRPAPTQSPVPKRVSEAILRGLALHPSQRWPSMAALLDELERARGRRGSAWTLIAAGGVGAVVAGSLALAWPSTHETAPSCAKVDESALAGIWDDARRTRLHAALESTGLPHAAASGRALEQALDGWVDEWVAVQRQACAATHEQGLQSTLVLDQQQSCLRGQTRRVEGLVDVLAQPDAAVLEHGEALLERLPDPRRCLVSPGQREPDEGVEALDTGLARVDGLLAVGKLEAARAALDELEHDIAALDDPATTLRAAGFRHQLAWAQGFEPAVAHAWRASADEARLAGLAEIEVDLRLDLAVAAVRWMPDVELASWLLDDAALVLELSDERGTARVHALRRARVQLLEREGRLDDAGREAERLLVELDAEGRVGQAALVRQTLANVEAEAGELDLAERDYLRARRAMAEVWGSESPNVAVIDHDLALLALERGDLDQAEQLLDRAEAIHRSNPGSLALADDRAMRVTLALYGGELGDAGEQARAALDVYERELGPNHETTLHMLELRGIVRYFEGDYEGSLADYDRVLPGYLAVHGPNDVFTAILHVNRGDTLLALDRPAEALREQERAHAILTALDHPLLAGALASRGEALLALGRVDAAIVDLEQALVGLEGAPTELAEAQFALARALAARGGEPERVADLSDRARASFESLGLTRQLQSLDRWRGR